MSTCSALLLLFFHLALTDGASLIREEPKKPAAALQDMEISARGDVASKLQEETSPRIETGKNDTAILLENDASSLSDADKSSGDSVQCKFTIDNHVDSASYGGQNLHIGGDRNKWEADKVVNFNLRSGAYLVICGRNTEGNSCVTGGFAISCNRHVSGHRGAWQAISDNNRRNGEGGGWHSPCASSSGFSLPSNSGAEKMFAGAANPACFRWRTPDIDCVMHNFGAWDACSKACGTGNQARTRGVKQNAKHGGKACPAAREERKCNTQPCSVDCVMHHFGAWGACSKTCGSGKQLRTRGVKQNAIHGGKACPAAQEEKECNTNPCPVDCEVNAWNDWGDCSETCGGGKMQRNRTVETEVQHGGQACPTLTNSTECNTQECVKAAARGVVLSEMALIYLIALLCFHLSARY